MTAQLINKDSKAILARLLATEDLTIEHKNVSTAAFDPKSRVLTLPIWKDMTGDIYDLMILHEVGHSLYSPTLDAIPAGVKKSWVNVVEDARIEKLIKRKFPGSAINFFRGYKELVEKNFFETKGRELNSYSLIDRINLHFKNVPLVPFSDEEKQYVSMVADCETFDDVIDAVKKIYEYAQEREQEFEDIDVDDSEFGDEGSFEEAESEQQESQLGDSEQESDDDTKGDSEEENFTRSQDDKEYGEEKDISDRPNELGDSETEESWNRNQENLLDESVRNYNYLSLPEVNLDEIVVDWREYGKQLSHEIETLRNKGNYSPYNYASQGLWQRFENGYYKFKQSNTKSVNYLVKEFEMKKSADEYLRSSIAKTGVIDTNSLHSYKWNEDIFKRLTIVPGAKNHGMIFFLDWSGSMNNCIQSTVKQLYNLIWFCSKVQIPFEVYAFSELETYRNPFGQRQPASHDLNQIAIHNGIRLHQIFTSEMKTKQLEEQMLNFWLLTHGVGYFSNWFHLGGTPLIEAIISSKFITEKFLKKHKVQKMNLVFLTDGEANPMMRWIESQYKYSNKTMQLTNLNAWCTSQDKFVLRDNCRTYELDKFDSFKQVKTMLQWLKDNMNVNLIGFRLCNDRDARNYLYYLGSDLQWDTINSKWRKDRSYSIKNIGGYDELYLIKNDNVLGADAKDIDVEVDATKAQLKKAFSTHMKSKMVNKVILNKFIGAIA
jgi:hypothetical protein